MKRDYKVWTEEELIEWIGLFDTIADMRADDSNKYHSCLRKGLKGIFPKKNVGKKYTDEQLIEWASSFASAGDARLDNGGKYATVLRRGLGDHFNRKRKKKSAWTEEQREEWKKHSSMTKEEKQVIRRQKLEEKRALKGTPKEVVRVKRKRIEVCNLDSTTVSRMYTGVPLEGGIIICGRCGEQHPRNRHSTDICNLCYAMYMKYRRIGIDHNKWNVRDEFCHTTIKHYEKTFNIGIKVDERMQNYLTLIGYGFIFKEVYVGEKQPTLEKKALRALKEALNGE
jgi:hypothetical protein